MDVAALLQEVYGRLPPLAHEAVDGASTTELTRAPSEGANTIAWLVWHTARVQDHHVAEQMGEGQLWDGAWAARFGVDADADNTGYGYTPEQVRKVGGTSEDLTAYLEAVHSRTTTWLATLSAADLDTVVDRRWDPPVTLGVRLVSVADDGLQHLGQACYLRGLAAR